MARISTLGNMSCYTDAAHRLKSEAGDAPAIYRNLYEVIRSGDRSRLAVKPEETVDVLRLIELGQRSSKEGRIIPVSEA